MIIRQGTGQFYSPIYWFTELLSFGCGRRLRYLARRAQFYSRTASYPVAFPSYFVFFGLLTRRDTLMTIDEFTALGSEIKEGQAK